MLLGVGTHPEGGHGDHLLADADVTLADQDTCVVDGLGQTVLVHEGLEAALQEVLEGESKHVVKLHVLGVQKAVTVAATEKGTSLEDTALRVGVKGKQTTCTLAHLRQGEGHTPHLTLATKPVVSDQLQLLVQPLLLERTTGVLVDLPELTVFADHF